MKKITFLLIFSLLPALISAQQLMKIVYVNKGAIVANPKEAEWLVAIRKVNGLYERNDYVMNGPLKKVKTFKDLNQTILEGNYLEYDDKGNLQLAGYYTDNKKSGKWFYFSDSGKIIRTENFEGTGIFEEEGNKIATKDLFVPPSFKSGKTDWNIYLHENLNRDNIINRTKDERIEISFSVTTTGALKNFVLIRSEYFYADNEMIRTLSAAPKWKPASVNGTPVAYRYHLSIDLYDLFHEK